MSDPIYTEILIDEGEHPQNKGTIDVCDAMLSDDSGEIKFTLWGG